MDTSKPATPAEQTVEKRDKVNHLLYLYVMLTPEEQKQFNRKLRVLRDNGPVFADIVERWKALARAADGKK